MGDPYQAQVLLKSQNLKLLLAAQSIELNTEISFLSSDIHHLRDRLDFSYLKGVCGLYDKSKKELVDILSCTQLSPALQNWYHEFRRHQLPLERASIRLRVSPDGKKGLWIDAANVDIKSLLLEKTYLQQMLLICEVEIGQRRKKPFWNGTEFKLGEPEHQVWFQSWAEHKPVNLYCQIASFTQPSHKANKLICQTIEALLKEISPKRIIEFGSGIGNLTFAAATHCELLTACEIDKISLEGLEKSLQFLPQELSHLKDRVQIYAGDFQRRIQMDFSSYDCVLANPPRSGLMSFIDSLETLSDSKRPRSFIYMSCFPESFAVDAKRLYGLGYQIKKLNIVDQFPQTEHFELIALLERI